MRIYEVAGGYQMITAPVFATFLRKLYKGPQSAEKLSKPALETLAIIAYKQPLSKLEIESLRKVSVDGVMATLLDKNLIRITGRKKTPGRPKVYGTSREFLEYFGLKSLEELPKIDNFPLPQELLESQMEPTKKEVNNVPGETA
jgi:segregation and condensation protein B